MKTKLTQEDIKAIESKCEESVWEPFPGATIVAWNLPNGFTISDQSGCVDPKNYCQDIGVRICREHLRDQLWKLYGFALKEQFSRGEAEC